MLRGINSQVKFIRIKTFIFNSGYEVFTSPLCLAIAFYFAEKKNKKTARGKIELVAKHLNISPVSENTVKKAIDDPNVKDFEDGLEYYSARESKCKCIITEDVNDFYFSEIEVLTCEAYFEKYLARKNR